MDKISALFLDASNAHGSDLCPYIALSCQSGLMNYEQLRNFPSKQTRFSALKIIQSLDLPNIEIESILGRHTPLNQLIYFLIDYGWNLEKIGRYLRELGL